jgi:hypothetical protein
VTAHGVADHHRPAPAERVQDPQEVAGKVLRGVGGRRRPVALAVAPLVERHDVAAIGEGRGHQVEPVGMGGASVQEAEPGLPRLTPFQGVQAEAADLQGPPPAQGAAYL